MIIRHEDRNGEPWFFTIDCNPIQESMFKQFLACVRSVGRNQELCLRFYEDKDENEAFRKGMETAILSALKTWVDSRTAPPPPPQRHDTDADENEDRVRYYWENF